MTKQILFAAHTSDLGVIKSVNLLIPKKRGFGFLKRPYSFHSLAIDGIDNALDLVGSLEATGDFGEGASLSYKKRRNAQFLGQYNAHARGEDIVNDLNYEIEQLKVIS